jgi:hypothetical protein
MWVTRQSHFTLHLLDVTAVLIHFTNHCFAHAKNAAKHSLDHGSVTPTT